MHGEHVGIAQSPLVASAYFVVSLLMVACSRLAEPVEAPEDDHGHEIAATAAAGD